MRRFGLSLKIFLGTAAVVTAVLLVTLIVTSSTSRANAERVIQAGLAETNVRIGEQLFARQVKLQGELGIFAQNRDVMTTITKDTVGSDALDQAQQAAEVTHASWVQIVDAHGFRLAKSDDRAAPKSEIRSALVTGVLERHKTAGFGVMGDSMVMQIVAVPLLSNLNDSGSVVAVLMAAQPITDSLARTIGKATGSEVAFYVVDTSGRVPHIAGSTIAPEERPRLQQEVAARVLPKQEDVQLAGGAKGEAARGVARSSMMGSATERATFTVGGTQYVGQGTPLLGASGRPIGGFVAMRSLDAELAGYYGLRRALLLTGAAGLLIAFLLSGVITRQIVSPVTALVAATRRAADGDYNAEIPATSRDEIGTLADAVRRLLSDLRDKQALVEFLGGNRAMAATTVGGAEATQLMSQPTVRLDRGELAPGQSLGVRYDIKALLGAGGMGMVYRAVDRELQEIVAIKTLRPEMIANDSTALERFKSEIRIARKISHRNVVRTHDLGESQGLYFITMEYVEGTSLKDLVITRGRLPVHVLLPIAKQLCRALEVAHDSGVIHRDIKPQNMVVESDGTLKVMDFGIARLATRPAQAGLTQAGMVIGTPEYMAPEQLLGDELDARADVYSAGVVLYECLTGRLPFEAPTPIALISRVLEETPPAPRSLHADIPEALSVLVLRVMARDRDTRIASAKDLHDALEQIG